MVVENIQVIDANSENITQRQETAPYSSGVEISNWRKPGVLQAFIGTKNRRSVIGQGTPNARYPLLQVEGSLRPHLDQHLDLHLDLHLDPHLDPQPPPVHPQSRGGGHLHPLQHNAPLPALGGSLVQPLLGGKNRPLKGSLPKDLLPITPPLGHHPLPPHLLQVAGVKEGRPSGFQVIAIVSSSVWVANG